MPVNNIQCYHFTDQDRLFFDANIWVYIYGPQTQTNRYQHRIYSGVYKDIISRGSKIYIDVVVLSELINRVARFHYNLWQENQHKSIGYKEYRAMDEFKPIASDIKSIVHMILVDSKPVDTCFSQMDQRVLMDSFESENTDFNDLIIINVCRMNNLVLITHDSDMRNADIQILTSNRQLLNP